MPLIKIVYFDEESASDLLDMTAGGKEETSVENIKERSEALEAKVMAKLLGKLNLMPFIGASAEASASGGTSRSARNVLHKTLSNTILTDYLQKFHDFDGVELLEELRLSARRESAAFLKMYAPYMRMIKMEEAPLDLAGFDDTLESAKGYYELVGEGEDGVKHILRFNIGAFRNNYGLADLQRMQLVFHGVKVGRAREDSLTMQSEMAPSGTGRVTVEELTGEDDSAENELIDVYDVLLAGVEVMVPESDDEVGQ